MTRSILLATTGESPQVVTETLFAIAQRGQAWPEAIWLITTSVGKSRACEGLLDAGHLARLCHELKKPQPAFNEHHVLVVPNAKGEPVDDARSLEDHQALGDFIMTQVRDLTAKNDIALHASLAGGRKTMTFYMGYAMSLFGRAQDTLSHVLISEGFEGLRDFWFPSQRASTAHPARWHRLSRCRCASHFGNHSVYSSPQQLAPSVIASRRQTSAFQPAG